MNYNSFLAYQNHFKDLKTHYKDEKELMSLVVGGGGFETMGKKEFNLILQEGLEKKDTLVDIGCGSGRLAYQLKDYLSDGVYYGFDILPELIQYAEKICDRKNFNFKVLTASQIEKNLIPLEDNSIDWITFFSVCTHLPHKNSFLYLQEACRILKPGGKILISFLEFKIPEHFINFKVYVNDNRPEPVLNQFVSLDAWKMWIHDLQLNLSKYYPGNTKYIKISENESDTLGQSIIILEK